MPRLADKVAFITGAGSGIGRATAILFAREGAKVAIAEIDVAAGEETAHLAGHGAIAIPTDVTEPDSLERAIRGAVRHFGRLDILHNNAGGSTARDDTAVDAPLHEFWRAIKLDLYGTFLGCRFGIPELIRAGGGSVINMSSNVALMGVAGRDCYTAAKGGIAAITRSLAVAYAPQKVRVNAIAPSATMTERVKRLVAGNAALTRLANSHLLGLIEPDDIASSALPRQRRIPHGHRPSPTGRQRGDDLLSGANDECPRRNRLGCRRPIIDLENLHQENAVPWEGPAVRIPVPFKAVNWLVGIVDWPNRAGLPGVACESCVLST